MYNHNFNEITHYCIKHYSRPLQEMQINSCLKQYKEKYETLHVAATELHQKFLKLKQERDRYRDETVSLKEEIRRLKTRWCGPQILY